MRVCEHTWDDAHVQLPVNCLDPLDGIVLLMGRSQDLRLWLFHSILGVVVVADTYAAARG